jgi:cellulose synthase/poly-beta-1,6-N-acetylglucosamine synthase-like glycosyltransferase
VEAREMTSTLIGGILMVIGFILSLPILTIFVQVLAALPAFSARGTPQGDRLPVAVLVPAHDEELSIGETLSSIISQLKVGDRLIVIADNCSDRTAEIACQFRAEVTIRFEPSLRGKGYALEHGLNFLEQTAPPALVVFIDADCQLEEGCIDHLAKRCIESMRPVQAAYLMNPPRPPNKTASMVAFAWKVKDFARPLGSHRLGFPCQLAGSGMAFPWDVVRLSNLAGSQLAEDSKQGLDLALCGKFPLFCPDAIVTSDVVTGGKLSGAQRARWEHGSLENAIHYLPRLLIQFSKTWNFSLVAMALDLAVPPLALLALLLGSYAFFAFGFLIFSGVTEPIIFGSIECTLFLTTILLAWSRHGREFLPLHWLIFAPIYAASKIPLYARFIYDRQREWAKGRVE